MPATVQRRVVGELRCDVVSLLFSLKILYPQRVFLIRGNHEVMGLEPFLRGRLSSRNPGEDRLMNVNYGFHADCTRRHPAGLPKGPQSCLVEVPRRKFGRDGDGIWERSQPRSPIEMTLLALVLQGVNDVFEFLPIAALVEGPTRLPKPLLN